MKANNFDSKICIPLATLLYTYTTVIIVPTIPKVFVISYGYITHKLSKF